MFKIKKTRFLAVMGLNALALVSSLSDTQSQKDESNQPDRFQLNSANSASLKAIESSWIKVPRACKARGFNAEPVSVAIGQPNAKVMALYQILGA